MKDPVVSQVLAGSFRERLFVAEVARAACGAFYVAVNVLRHIAEENSNSLLRRHRAAHADRKGDATVAPVCVCDGLRV
ncbi:MAG: hypothetical protein WDN30_04100 [Pararobbsia sp.]